MGAIESPRHTDRQALTAELVDHGQQPQTAAIVRPRFDEIVAPDVIGPHRPRSDAGSVVKPQSSARLLLGRNLQAFPPPDALHTIFAHRPARLFQQGRDAPVAVAAVLASQPQHRLCQSVFVVALRRLVTLRSARLAHQPARVPFTASFFPSVLNGDAAPLGT